ncbi:MAG: AAA family ATPase [Candidatus Moranbacteria bacterium]|nr:AAA family ATPase [Candidatus Moranbacteria bacterium]
MNIIGHGVRRKLLDRFAYGDPLHHAFLFFGPEGVGKNLVAREFASALLGRPGEDPSSNQDFLQIVPDAKKDGGRRSISVDAVRDASLFLSRFPVESKRRIVIIDDADRMTEAAQNALLKTLEEPNSSSMLILITARTGQLRDTVVSRLFRVPFSPVSETEMRSELETEASGIESFFFSLGRPGIVLSAVADPDSFSKQRDLLRSLFRVSSLSFVERIALSERLSATPSEAADLLEWWVVGLRNMRRADTASRKNAILLYRLLEEIEKTIRTLRDSNANPRLCIDRLFLVSLR